MTIADGGPRLPAPWWARVAAGTSGAAGTAGTSGTEGVGGPEGTAADKRRYVEDGLVPVACRRCATTVRVKKHSRAHTSVQWATGAASSCPEIGAQIAAGAHGAQILGCGMLRQSIEKAVADGVLTVPDD
ncbi:MAG: hypothetical protein M3O28_10445 [Actinomycetota bacterium]|nr:hypothetical protein [Actinomycetota bacterium]